MDERLLITISALFITVAALCAIGKGYPPWMAVGLVMVHTFWLMGWLILRTIEENKNPPP